MSALISQVSAALLISGVLLAPLAAVAGGHRVCKGTGDPNGYVVCGGGCARGEATLSSSPQSHPSCEPTYVMGCTEVKNLHYELGWSGGHKTKFCRKKGFDGMTNHPNSSYKQHGGGWCYKGSSEACTQSLPRGHYR
ncbi:MAG: hypothetical protein KF683_01820 [Rubrivivax sp.]|nr:hypothetical protein [Rubrivivax sp.]